MKLAREIAENYAIARKKHQQIVAKLQEQEAATEKAKLVYDANWLTALDAQPNQSNFSKDEEKTRKEDLIRRNLTNLLNDKENLIGKKMLNFIVNWKHKSATSFLLTNSNNIDQIFQITKGEIKSFIQTTTSNVLSQLKRLEEPDVNDLTLTVIEDIICKNVFHNLFEFYKLKVIN